MEGLMATVVDLDASPSSVLRAMRGQIVAAQVAYPNALHVEVRDLVLEFGPRSPLANQQR
jgi:hypothetical protein